MSTTFFLKTEHIQINKNFRFSDQTFVTKLQYVLRHFTDDIFTLSVPSSGKTVIVTLFQNNLKYTFDIFLARSITK